MVQQCCQAAFPYLMVQHCKPHCGCIVLLARADCCLYVRIYFGLANQRHCQYCIHTCSKSQSSVCQYSVEITQVGSDTMLFEQSASTIIISTSMVYSS